MVDNEFEDTKLLRDFKLVFEDTWLNLFHENLVVWIEIPELELQIVALVRYPFASLLLFNFDLEDNLIKISVVLWVNSSPFTVDLVMLDTLDVEHTGLLEIPFNQISAELEVGGSVNTVLLHGRHDILVSTHLSRSNHTHSLVISSLETSDKSQLVSTCFLNLGSEVAVRVAG